MFVCLDPYSICVYATWVCVCNRLRGFSCVQLWRELRFLRRLFSSGWTLACWCLLPASNDKNILPACYLPLWPCSSPYTFSCLQEGQVSCVTGIGGGWNPYFVLHTVLHLLFSISALINTVWFLMIRFSCMCVYTGFIQHGCVSWWVRKKKKKIWCDFRSLFQPNCRNLFWSSVAYYVVLLWLE